MHRIVMPSELRPVPWNNGAGVTREIVRWPDSEDYAIRISIAELRSAALFSRFPGYRRWSFLAGDAQIGRGPCPRPVRFAFALAAQPALPQGHAVVLDPPELRALHRDVVWLCTSAVTGPDTSARSED